MSTVAELERDNRILRYQIETLEIDTERMREHLKHLEAIVFPKDVRCPPVWCLTPTEARVVVLLARGQFLTKDRLHHFLYESRMTDDAADPKIVDVLIHKIRKKLDPFGFTIVTVWGQGYNFSPEAAAEVRRQIEAASHVGAAVMLQAAATSATASL